MFGTKAGAGTKNESPSLGHSLKMIPLNNIVKRFTGGNAKASKNRTSSEKQINLRFLRIGSMSSAATTTTMRSDRTALAKSGLVGGVLARLRSTASNEKGDKTSKLHDLLDVTASSSASYLVPSAKATKIKTSGKSEKPAVAGSFGGITTKSRAIFCPAPGRDVEHEVDELDNEHRERMYADATWRMYDRIMTARANRPEPDPAAIRSSVSGIVAPKPTRTYPVGEGRSDMSDSSEHRRYQEYGGIFALDDC